MEQARALCYNSYLLLSYVDIIVYLDVIENPVIPVRILKCLRNKSKKLKESVYKRILPSLPSCNVTFM